MTDPGDGLMDVGLAVVDAGGVLRAPPPADLLGTPPRQDPPAPVTP